MHEHSLFIALYRRRPFTEREAVVTVSTPFTTCISLLFSINILYNQKTSLQSRFMFRASNSLSIEHVDKIDTNAAHDARDHNRAPSPSVINKSVIYKRCPWSSTRIYYLCTLSARYAVAYQPSLPPSRTLAKPRISEMYRQPSDRTVIDYVQK